MRGSRFAEMAPIAQVAPIKRRRFVGTLLVEGGGSESHLTHESYLAKSGVVVGGNRRKSPY